jgi:hypothetical protein
MRSEFELRVGKVARTGTLFSVTLVSRHISLRSIEYVQVCKCLVWCVMY